MTRGLTQAGILIEFRIAAAFNVTVHSTLNSKQEDGRKGVILFEKTKLPFSHSPV
jgi:hypothetical protein